MASTINLDLLPPARIIRQNVPCPAVEHHSPDWPFNAEQSRAFVAETREAWHFLCYNKTQADRICPFCRTLYTVLPERSGEPQIETERRLSGICSRKCWREGTGTDEKKWLGQEADSVVMDAKGKGVMVRKDGKLASTFADGKGAVVHTPLSDAAARELENRGPQLRTCANCRATGDWSICSGCRLAHYCSPDCQRGHWKSHKAECKRQAEMLALALHGHETGQWNDRMLTGGARLAVSRM